MKHILVATIAAVVLVGCGPSVDIHEATKEGNIVFVRRGLSKGADINAKDDDGFTPLHWTAIKGHKEIVELLIDNGANVNPKGDEFGMTPLHKAASKGHREITELLIANGADVNAKVVSSPTARTALLEGSTPLETAKNKETFDLLRKHGGKTGAELKAEGK